MQKMKRFAAWVVLMAILLSSFAFAEENMAAVEPAAVEMEYADVAEASDGFVSSETGSEDCEHSYFLEDGRCAECGMAVGGGDDSDGFTSSDTGSEECEHVPVRNEAGYAVWIDFGDGTHGPTCAECSMIMYQEPHYTDDREAGSCTICGAWTEAQEGPGEHECYPDKLGYNCNNDFHTFCCAICGEYVMESHEVEWCEVVGSTGHNIRYLPCGFEQYNLAHSLPCTYMWGDPVEGVNCLYCGYAVADGMMTWMQEHVDEVGNDGFCDACRYVPEEPEEHECAPADKSGYDCYTGWHTFTCATCGEFVEEDHPNDTATEFTDSRHLIVNEKCGYSFYEKHYFPCSAELEVKEESDAECLFCGYAYRDIETTEFYFLHTGANLQNDKCDDCNPYSCKRGHDWLVESGRYNYVDLGRTHAMQCYYCDYTTGEEEHFLYCFTYPYCGRCYARIDDSYEMLHQEFNEDGECTFCGWSAICKHKNIKYVNKGDGTHEQVCPDCEEVFSVEAHSYANGKCTVCNFACAHDGESEWIYNGNGTHSSRCLICSYAGAGVDCMPGCADAGKCGVCGADYTGDAAPAHSYIGSYTDLGNGKHALVCVGCGKQDFEAEHFVYCREEGSKNCSACGAVFDGAKVEHDTWDEENERENWKTYNQYMHVLRCLDCYAKVGSMGQPHTFDYGYCTGCGVENTCRHRPSMGFFYRDLGDGTHAKRCWDCKDIVEVIEHDFYGGKCSKCGAIGECGHESSAWKDLGNGTHGKVCAFCGIKTSDETQAHYVKCTSGSNKCTGCGAEVSADEITHNYLNWWGEDNWKNLNYGKHALVCEDCGEEKPGTREAHSIEGVDCSKCSFYVNANHKCFDYCDSNSGYCYECGKPTTGVDHRGGGMEVKVNEYFHGFYCERCKVYYNLTKHHNYCFHDGYCDEKEGSACWEKVDPDYVPVQHNYRDAKLDSRNPDYHVFTCNLCGVTERELHNVSCTTEGAYCGDCGAYVEQGKKHKNINYWSEEAFVMPNDPSKHGWACECGEFFYPTAHNYLNGFCVDCGVENMGVSSVKFISGAKTMAVSQEEYAVLEIEGAPSKIVFKSSNAKVAAVDESGLIIAKKAGSATISVSVSGADGTSAKAEMKLTVKKAPTKITLSDKEIDMGAGGEAKLTVKLSSGAYSPLYWTSSDESVAFVDESDTIYAANEGTATISVETFNGKKASCVVNVLGEPAELILDVTELKLNPKKSFTIKGEVRSASGGKCGGSVSFESADPGIAAVDAKGKVTAKKVGETTILVSTYNGITAEVRVGVYNAPKKVSLDVTKATINRGETLQLNAIIGDDEYAALTWSTKSKKIATVDENGLVTPVSEGSTTITVKTDNGKKATAKITVVDPFKPASVELNQSGTVILPLGETLQLSASLKPETAQSGLSWSSSKKKVATVDENGLVTPVKEGSTKITVETYNGKTDTLTVKVVDPSVPAEVMLDAEGTVRLAVGETLQLNAQVAPATAETELKWSTSSKKVAAVDENGLVTAVKKGSATITVKTSNGLKDTVKIKVS